MNFSSPVTAIPSHHNETRPESCDEPVGASNVACLNQRKNDRENGRKEDGESSSSNPNEQGAAKKQKKSGQEGQTTQSNSHLNSGMRPNGSGRELQIPSRMHQDNFQNLLRLQEAQQREQREQLLSSMPPFSREQMLYNQYLGNPGGQFLNTGQEISLLNRMNNDALLLNQQFPRLNENLSLNSFGNDYEILQRLHLLDRMRMMQETNSFPHPESLLPTNLTANQQLEYQVNNQANSIVGNTNFNFRNHLNTGQNNLDLNSSAANQSSIHDSKTPFNAQSQGGLSSTSSSTLIMGQQDTGNSETTARRISCRARHMPITHNEVSAYFEITSDTAHGAELCCSHPECRKNGTKFRYCAYCKVAAAKRNFITRHGHHEARPTQDKPTQKKASIL